MISKLIQSFAKCKYCDHTYSLTIVVLVDNNLKCGLAQLIIFKCAVCDKEAYAITSTGFRNMYEVNIRYAYTLQSIGEGLECRKMFAVVVNMSYTNKIFEKI